ncbi:hypothetical protein HK102_008164 [Quaeritorhiza haematococci]|nr:hypothetical protein HK102_008164 [Quaeritorhiza haematococci]
MVSWNPIRAAVVLCGVLALSQASSCHAAPIAPREERLTVSIDTFPVVRKLPDAGNKINNVAPRSLEPTGSTPDAFPIDITPLIQKLQAATNKINSAAPGSLVSPVDLEAQRTHFQEMFNAAQSKLQAMSQDIPELQMLQQQLQAFDEAVMKATNVNAQTTPLAKREPFRGGRWSGRIGTLADVMDIFASGCQLAGLC